MVVQPPLLVLMRAHVKQVRLDGPVDEIRRKVEEHDSDHDHRDGPDAPQRPVTDQRCRHRTRISREQAPGTEGRAAGSVY